MKIILAIVLAVAVGLPAHSQNVSGIFLSVQCAKKSAKQTVAISGKQVCLAPNPIILPNEFTSVTGVMEQGDRIWFDVTVSAKALQMLLQLSSNLPSSTFAFVLENDVFSTFSASELNVGRTFRFQGTGKHKSMFTDAQKKIKALIDSKTQ